MLIVCIEDESHEIQALFSLKYRIKIKMSSVAVLIRDLKV